MMPSRADIESQNECLLKVQRDFRLAVEFVAAAMSEIVAVGKVVLFGSVARPLIKEVPRFSDYRRAGIAVWHECRDVDLAVWVNSPENLEALRKAKVKGLKIAAESKNLTVADHQVDVFILEPGPDSYLGRLCNFNKCPKGKGKIKCMAPGCGRVPFLQEIPGFHFAPDGLDEDVSTVLFER